MESVIKRGINKKIELATREIREEGARTLKARPTCRKSEMEQITTTRLKYRGIEDWNIRLKHMDTILTAEKNHPGKSTACL